MGSWQSQAFYSNIRVSQLAYQQLYQSLLITDSLKEQVVSLVMLSR